MKRMASISLAVLAAAACAASAMGCAVATEPTSAPTEASGGSSDAAGAKKAPGSPQTEAIRVTSPCATIAPTYLLRIPDNDGAHYWSDMRDPPTASPDGYTIPFPTPWITNNSNTLVDWYADLSYEPDVFTYEGDQWGLPSSKDYQYLVKEITVTACPPAALAPPGPCLAGYVSDKEWFTVPFTSWSDLQAAVNYAYFTPYTAPNGTYSYNFNVEPNVNSQIRECVHIMDGSGLIGTGLRPVESDVFVDIHDPHNPPFPP